MTAGRLVYCSFLNAVLFFGLLNGAVWSYVWGAA